MIAQLKKLPRGLADTYDRIWTRINSERCDPTERKWALETLILVLYAKEPLTEQTVLAFTNPDSTSLISDQTFQASGIKYLIRVCANLVVLDGQMNVLRFVHFSAQEFLRGKLGSDSENNGHLADVCFAVLAAEAGSVQGSIDDSIYDSIDKNTSQSSMPASIYHYASKYWHEHAKFWDEINSHRAHLIQQFLLNRNRFNSWRRYVTNLNDSGTILWIYSDKLLTLDRYISYHNLPVILKHLVEHCSSVDWKGSLSIAAQNNHLEIAGILIQAGTDVNFASEEFDRPLILAVDGESEEIATLLLKAGSDANARSNDGELALVIAVNRGKEAIAILLIKAGANVNARSMRGDPVLIEAIFRGSIAMVQTLLNACCDPNVRSRIGEPALSAVVRQRSEVTRTVLTMDGSGVSAEDKTEGEFDLRLETLVTLLITHGSDVNGRNPSGRTALMIAVGDRSERLVSLLLDFGADVAIVAYHHLGSNYYPRSAIRAAVDLDWEEMVTRLLDARTSVDAHGGIIVLWSRGLRVAQKRW